MKDRWKHSRNASFDLSSDQIKQVKKERAKQWKRKEPLAKAFGVERKEYDLDDNVKKITNYNPKVVNGKPIVEKETVYLDRPFSHKRHLSASERKKLPLPLTSCCKWVGLTNFPVGTWAQRFREPLGWFDGFANSEHVSPLLKDKRDQLLSRYTLVDGSWATNRSLLVDMAQPPQIKHSPSAYELLDSSLDRLHLFGLPQLDCVVKKWWLKAATMKSEANPGLVSRRELGPTKRTAYGAALLVAQRIWDKIVTSKSPICDTSLWAVGGRARKQDMSKGKAPESRMVLMPELPNSIISAAIAQPIIKAIKKESILNPSNECFMGQDTTLGGWNRIKKFVDPGTPTLELDWSKFDSTVTENTLVAAFCLLRTCFPQSRKVDKLFLFVMSGTIYKNVAIKQRFIYKLTRGIPSGSPFTSLLVTLCNWISINYTLRGSGLFGVSGPDDYKLAIAGDDTLIAFTNSKSFKLEHADDVVKTFKEYTNLRTEPDDLNFNEWYGGELFEPSDIEFAPSLLKTTIWQGLPGRRLVDLVRAISCPESKVRSYWDVLDVIKGYTSIPIYNPLGRALMLSLGSFVNEKISEQYGTTVDDRYFDPYSPDTYLPRCESLVILTDYSEQMLRDPPYLSKDKWNGDVLRGWKVDLVLKMDISLFGVS